MHGSWRTSPLPRNWKSEIVPMVLRRDPICLWGILPGEQGECNRASSEVDHIGLNSDHSLESLRGICTLHHRARSASQGVEGRARIRAERPKQRPKSRHPGIKEG